MEGICEALRVSKWSYALCSRRIRYDESSIDTSSTSKGEVSTGYKSFVPTK